MFLFDEHVRAGHMLRLEDYKKLEGQEAVPQRRVRKRTVLTATNLEAVLLFLEEETTESCTFRKVRSMFLFSHISTIIFSFSQIPSPEERKL
jgi:hypothetical protein